MINEFVNEQILRIENECRIIKPKLVIYSLAFNHGSYIRDALEGFVNQKTNFPFVAIIHDDKSTDGTTEILRKYADRYPEIIKPIYELENQYSKLDGSLRDIMSQACLVTGAKYVAMCECDDYWLDPLKLQKQVTFLDSHPDIIYTCHRYKVQEYKNPILIEARNFYLDTYVEAEGFEFDLQYVFKCDWVTKTLTSVFRIECLQFSELHSCTLYRDVHNIYQILSHGKGFCFQFTGAVYRKQESGVWSQSDPIDNAYKEVKTWEEINYIQPSSLNSWKITQAYAYYVHLCLKKKKGFKLENIKEFLRIFLIPKEWYKAKRKSIIKQEIRRVRKLNIG